MKKQLQDIFALALRLYFRKIEIYGEEHVPQDGPVIFVLNHPNALVDPLFIFCLAPRDVSFLAKSTMFSMPILGYLVKRADCIPVYRKVDGGDTSKNQEMFKLCREMLNKGKALALFPEGHSHDLPKMMKLKTGTARIALGAASKRGEGPPVRIVPAGLYFTEKSIYRSKALLYYGSPIEVDVVELDENGEPPRDVTVELTSKLTEALTSVVLEAQHEEALSIVQRAEAIFSGGMFESDTLVEEMEMRKRFSQAYEALQEAYEPRITRLKHRIEHFELRLEGYGVSVETLTPQHFSTGRVLRFVSKRLLSLPIVLPLAFVGTILHYPSYRLVGMLAKRIAKRHDDMLSTVKILGAMIFFPLVWVLVGGALGYFHSPLLGLLGLLVTPITAWVATSFWEHLDDIKIRARALGLFLTRRKQFDDLIEEQKWIREEIVALGQLAEQQEYK